MDKKFNRELIPTAKMLRKNMTPEEKHLWYDYLRTYPLPFRRQKIIGNYIVDFYCAQAKLVVELDGSQHYNRIGIARDDERTKFLNTFGVTVLRIPNFEIKNNFDGVCAYIDKIVRENK